MAQEIILIGAVGRQGQLGLNGGLPWGDDFIEDRRRFRDVTKGHIVVLGFPTWRSLVHLDGTFDRLFKGVSPREEPKDYIEQWRIAYPQRKIFVAGGARIYARWLPYITRLDITVLPYDGPCDIYMPPLFMKEQP